MKGTIKHSKLHEWLNSNSIANKMRVNGKPSWNDRVKTLNEKEDKKYKGRRSSAKKAQNQK